uniref:Uncharacterized protein n=1 Tax=Anguilla anguilla TaxID=7936 RepID=A0A0E9UJX1_ANGAN
MSRLLLNVVTVPPLSCSLDRCLCSRALSPSLFTHPHIQTVL